MGFHHQKFVMKKEVIVAFSMLELRERLSRVKDASGTQEERTAVSSGSSQTANQIHNILTQYSMNKSPYYAVGS